MSAGYQHHRLANGLTILADPQPTAHTAALGFFVRTGARDEARPLMGVSHFLEHMMFKGTARRTADDVNREFDEIGADYNAFTSHENTVYFAHVLPEFLPRATDLLSDMLRPALREDDFTMEKNVILEEISMYEDRPQWRLQDAALESYFQEHSLAHRVLGTQESIRALSASQMRAYFEQRYSADNITVAAAGRFEFDVLVRHLEQLTAHWQPAQARRAYQAPQPAGRQITLTDAKLNRAYLAVVFPGPSAQDPLRYAAGVWADVVGAGEGSRLYWNLVDPGLADEADLSHLAQDRCGAYFSYVSCAPERLAQVEQVLLQTIDQYPTTIDPAEIERAKNKLATGLTLRGERPLGRMMNLGSQWIYLGQYLPLEQELAHLMAVDAGAVARLLQAWRTEPRTLVRLKPE